MERLNGFIIIMSNGQLGYDEYSYFTTDKKVALEFLSEVSSEHPDMRVVAATVEYESLVKNNND